MYRANLGDRELTALSSKKLHNGKVTALLAAGGYVWSFGGTTGLVWNVAKSVVDITLRLPAEALWAGLVVFRRKSCIAIAYAGFVQLWDAVTRVRLLCTFWCSCIDSCGLCFPRVTNDLQALVTTLYVLMETDLVSNVITVGPDRFWVGVQRPGSSHGYVLEWAF